MFWQYHSLLQLTQLILNLQIFQSNFSIVNVLEPSFLGFSEKSIYLKKSKKYGCHKYGTGRETEKKGTRDGTPILSFSIWHLF